jgi:hypothetical protein
LSPQGCCINASARVESDFARKKLFDCAIGQSFLSTKGLSDRWCTMRDEFASKSFLVVTVAGVVLLFSGMVSFAFI